MPAALLTLAEAVLRLRRAAQIGLIALNVARIGRRIVVSRVRRRLGLGGLAVDRALEAFALLLVHLSLLVWLAVSAFPALARSDRRWSDAGPPAPTSRGGAAPCSAPERTDQRWPRGVRAARGATGAAARCGQRRRR